jgi:hypothetical protein
VADFRETGNGTYEFLQIRGGGGGGSRLAELLETPHEKFPFLYLNLLRQLNKLISWVNRLVR